MPTLQELHDFIDKEGLSILPTESAKPNAVLPWRDRVELYAVAPNNQVLSGLYSNDGFPGVPGGGIEEGQTPQEAAAREFKEEVGYDASDVQMLPVEPFTQDWRPPYKTPQEAERSKQFRGSRTHFATGKFDPSKREPPVEPSGLKYIRLRRLQTLMRQLQAGSDEPRTAERMMARLQAVRALDELLKAGAATVLEARREVENCETCERFGPPKKAIAQGDADAFFEYVVCHNRDDCDSGEIGGVSDKEMRRLEREWTALPAEDKLRYHRQTKSSEEAPRRPSVAVDLDGTLAEELDKFDPEEIGPPREEAKKWMDTFAETGARIIILTCRKDSDVLRDWLAEHEIPYDHINENPDQPPDTSDKVYADVYWDNRAVDASGPLRKSAPQVLERLRHKAAACRGTISSLHEQLDATPVSVKLAATPYYQQGLLAQLRSPLIDTSKGLPANLMANLTEAKNRAARMVQEQDSLNDIQSALSPGFALARARRALRGQDFVTDPVDQFLFRR